MTPDDDVPITDMTRLLSALEHRAGGDTSIEAAQLLSSAQRRGATLYRRQMAGGALVVLLFAGGLVGAVVANHGRTTVGVSVSGPTATPTTGEGPTTTVGDGYTLGIVSCGDAFFPAATWTALEAHFGTKMDCARVGTTWLLTFRGMATTAAVLRCDVADAPCLDANHIHDFASFKAVFLPHVSSTAIRATWSTDSNGSSADATVELTWLPPVPPTPTPVSSLRISGPPADLAFEYGVTCERSDGPSTTDWAGKPMDVMSGQAALAALVPDWRTTPPMNPC
jgi:hypothetical protein